MQFEEFVTLHLKGWSSKELCLFDKWQSEETATLVEVSDELAAKDDNRPLPEVVLEIEDDLDRQCQKARKSHAIRVDIDMEWRRHYRCLRRRHEGRGEIRRQAKIRSFRRRTEKSCY